MRLVTLISLLAVAAFAENFGGIGVTIESSKLGIQLVSVIPGSPAEVAGLVAGDQVISVDGKSIQGLPLDAAKELIRGQANSPVLLEVVKGTDGEVWAGSLVRRGLEVQTVNSQDLNSWYGSESALSPQKVWEYAENKKSAGYDLHGVLQYGRLVDANGEADVATQDISTIYMGATPAIHSAPKPVMNNSSIGFLGFDRHSIQIKLENSGATRISLMDLKGSQVASWNRDVSVGALTLSWNGAALPVGSYTLKASQGSAASSWEVQLR
jgi:hypothetical protein